jgi:hypothetical protein
VGATFHNVVLAGVYDIKNLKLKMIHAGTHQLQDGEKRINSPWNIATDFEVDMSLSVTEIANMLADYERDEHTGMSIPEIAAKLRYYTSGYPFLVSKLCKTIDEKLSKSWTVAGIQEAIRRLLLEQNTLFDDIGKNIENNPELKELLRQLLEGIRYNFSSLNQAMSLGVTFGILSTTPEGNLSIHNSIFETLLYNYFSIEQEIARNGSDGDVLRPELIRNGKLNMQLLIEKFQQHYYELYSERDSDFLERECRLLFLTYLRPVINGRGFYHVESETRNSQRMDIIVDYGAEQHIVELKIWRGQQQHAKAYRQLADYLDSRKLSEGYLITFDFTKKGKYASAWKDYEGKKIFDCDVWSGRR